MSNVLLSCIPNAQRIDLSHNVHRHACRSLRCFIRERKLTPHFPSRAELRLAVDQNELWLLSLHSPNKGLRTFAAARFAVLIACATGKSIALQPSDKTVAPPFPRHDFGLHILGVRMGDLGERWRMTWYELSPTWPNTLESRSLDTLMIQALQLHARSTAETVIAVRQMVGRL